MWTFVVQILWVGQNLDSSIPSLEDFSVELNILVNFLLVFFFLSSELKMWRPQINLVSTHGRSKY